MLDVARAAQLGIALVPRDRGGVGLAMTLSLVENLTVPRVQTRRWRFWMGQSWQRREFARAVELLGIVPPRPELAAAQLSGGNQQKLLVSKWMLQNPAVLVLHEPTQAVDVGARRDLLLALRRAADTGVAVVIVSIESEDLASVCDRVLVFDSGVVAHELREGLTAEDIRQHTAAAVSA
jgi:ribose transport system ATP-binding protein